MYPASAWSALCSGPSWISARMRARYRSGLDWAIRVTSVGMRREDRFSIVVLSSCRPRRANGDQTTSLVTPHFALLLCSCCGRSFVPAWACRRSRAGRQGSRGSGRHCIGLDAREGAPLVENRPGDAGELVGQRNGEHVVVQPLFRRLDPRLEPIALPMLWPELDQHDPG